MGIENRTFSFVEQGKSRIGHICLPFTGSQASADTCHEIVSQHHEAGYSIFILSDGESTAEALAYWERHGIDLSEYLKRDTFCMTGVDVYSPCICGNFPASFFSYLRPQIEDALATTGKVLLGINISRFLRRFPDQPYMRDFELGIAKLCQNPNNNCVCFVDCAQLDTEAVSQALAWHQHILWPDMITPNPFYRDIADGPENLHGKHDACDSSAIIMQESINNALLSISHDLRKPLATIEWLAGIMKKNHNEGNDMPAEHVERIISIASSSKNLIDDLLYMCTAEADAAITEGIALDELVATVLGMLDRDIVERNVRVIFAPQSTRGIMLRHKTFMTSIIKNLLENAIQYTGDENISPHVWIETTRTPAGLSISVRDNGVGIARRDQDRIFLPFFRTPQARHTSGRGIGLSLVKRMLDALGGTVSVASMPGEGSEFRIVLPPGLYELL